MTATTRAAPAARRAWAQAVSVAPVVSTSSTRRTLRGAVPVAWMRGGWPSRSARRRPTCRRPPRRARQGSSGELEPLGQRRRQLAGGIEATPPQPRRAPAAPARSRRSACAPAPATGSGPPSARRPAAGGGTSAPRRDRGRRPRAEPRTRRDRAPAAPCRAAAPPPPAAARSGCRRRPRAGRSARRRRRAAARAGGDGVAGSPCRDPAAARRTRGAHKANSSAKELRSRTGR